MASMDVFNDDAFRVTTLSASSRPRRTITYSRGQWESKRTGGTVQAVKWHLSYPGSEFP